MSIIFWRKNVKANDVSVAVTTTDPLPVQVLNPDDADPIAVALGASSKFIGRMGGDVFRSTTRLIRPANTTQYTAGDVVGDASTLPLYFPDIAINPGGGALLVDAICIDSTSETTKANLRLYLYDTQPTMAADNAAWAPVDNEEEFALSYIEFTSWEVGGTTNCKSFAKPINSLLTCAPGQTGIWGIVVERGTYTPVASEKLVVRLGVIRYA